MHVFSLDENNCSIFFSQRNSHSNLSFKIVFSEIFVVYLDGRLPLLYCIKGILKRHICNDVNAHSIYPYNQALNVHIYIFIQ